MDRAQELRSLMKSGTKKDDHVPLSGKDKAKLLKMMKEQSKQKEQTRPPVSAKPKPAVAPTSTQSGLPSDFFDAPSIPSVAAPVATRPPPSNTLNVANQASNSNNISNLPKGFFDNPVEDLNARGISMEQYTASMEKEEQAELDSFLTQLKGIEGETERLEEAADLRDETSREYEEEAAQMAYLANLIALRSQTEKLKTSSTNSTSAAGSLQTEGSEALGHLLKEVAEVRAATLDPTSAALDVDAILYQKLAQSAAQKRKRDAILHNILSTTATNTASDKQEDSANSSEDSDESSESESDVSSKKAKSVPAYTPLNYMNWTSRTY